MPTPDLDVPVVPEPPPPSLPPRVIADVTAGAPQVVPAASAPSATQPAGDAGPLTQVKANYQVTFPPGVVPRLGPDEGGAERHGTPKNSAAWLDQLSIESQPGMFKYLVKRIKPATHEGYRLIIGNVGTFDVLPYAAIVDAILQLHGGGDFQVLVQNMQNDVMGVVPVFIDPVQNPPRIPQNSQRVGFSGQSGVMSGMSGVAGMPPGMGGEMNSGVSIEMAEYQRSRMTEQCALQEVNTKKAQMQLRQVEKQLKSNEEGDEMKSVELLSQQMREMSQGMLTGLEKLAGALASSRDDKTMGALMESMREARAEQSKAEERRRETEQKAEQRRYELEQKAEERNRQARDDMMKTMLTVLATPKSTGEGEMVKAVLTANQQTTQAAVEAAKKESAQLNHLVELLFTSKLNSGENNLRQMLDMMDRGRQQATEQMQMVMEMNNQNQDVLSPDNGFWGNFGNMFLSGLNRLFQGIGSGAASRLGNMASALTPLLPAPSASAQSMLIPADGQVMQAPQPVQMPQQVYVPVAPAPVQQAPIQQAQAAQAPDNIVSMFYDGVLQDVRPATQQAAPSASSSQLAPVAVSADLSEHVTEALRMAISDIAAGRSEHDWADYAGGKWGNFLSALSQVTDDAARLRMIQGQCAPAVYAQFHQLLSSNPVGMRNFLTSLHNMLSEYQGQLRQVVA